ncbi:lipopolysaccharide biosynthesis protein [Paenibacillus antri]|uniref:Lipopolysaccharide biosynthesis protein n=1 Tax=Paenibacillus antri TaxID=2582848 RepID=A0A5R9GFH6_9BACL|nr:Wzz/FepE/Etk N-terminal domain-containing protein [Paenibacillus antri]TLS52004.1 lipopolysaccharide biosynthesis protein [Paenibacillus antri]
MELELELKDYVKIVRKRLWLILTVVVLASIAAGVVSMYVLKPVYEASTKLIVNQSNEAATGMQQLDLNAVNLNLRLIDTYKEIIKTPAIMDKVMSEHPKFGLTAGELSDKVRVSSVNNTQVMTLVVEDGSYERAAAIVNAISIVFQREIPSIMNVDNVSILNEAPSNASPSPVKPNVKLNIAIAFVVSLMVMLGIAFLLEYLDDTIKTERDVETVIGLPTLTAIAKTTDEDFTHGAKSSKRKVTDKRAVLEQ